MISAIIAVTFSLHMETTARKRSISVHLLITNIVCSTSLARGISCSKLLDPTQIKPTHTPSPCITFPSRHLHLCMYSTSRIALSSSLSSPAPPTSFSSITARLLLSLWKVSASSVDANLPAICAALQQASSSHSHNSDSHRNHHQQQQQQQEEHERNLLQQELVYTLAQVATLSHAPPLPLPLLTRTCCFASICCGRMSQLRSCCLFAADAPLFCLMCLLLVDVFAFV
jgi:hypothetical protein